MAVSLMHDGNEAEAGQSTLESHCDSALLMMFF